jgi:hypothetical protein
MSFAIDLEKKLVRRLAVFALLAAGAATAASARDAGTWKLGVGDPGLYRVTYEDLATAAPVGAPGEAAPESARLALSNRGADVPIWVEDGGDGRFGPGDSFLFEGRQLEGEGTYYAAYARWNVYGLRLAATRGARLPASPRSSGAGSAGTKIHREAQELRVRFAPKPLEPAPEVWYWAKLTAIDADPFRLSIELPDRDPAADVELRVGVRGWSTVARNPADGPADHRIDAAWNGAPAGTIEWRRQDAAVLVARLPAASIRAKNDLTLRVPRRSTSDGRPLVDVSLVDWIELESSGRLVVEAPRSPGWVEADQPSDWRSSEHRADYLMIGHRSLLAELEPLARLHRARGLAVDVVPVDDVYDEFSHGIEDPRAIRDFVAHARREWRAPAPRYLLLVGDASWDPFHVTGDDSRYADWTYRSGEQQVFVKNASTPYAEATGRGLVPTMEVLSYEGEAASDNAFVAIEGDDILPDLAVGRFPVVTAAEVAAIVAKTIRYATRAENGDWQKRALWITDQEPSFQAQSDSVIAKFASETFDARRVYPKKEEPDNLANKAEILKSFDEGNLFVHFFGHGGRYIWRTGPPDLVKNHDLFTLEDLDTLAADAPLPVILSMTCYSAPFDHPTADSIGEKFLRLADRGAVAVVAASWRNSPNAQWSVVLVEEMMRPGVTIGEALQAAKRAHPSRDFVETYNLLGDPAIRLAVKANRNVIRWQTASEVENFGYDVYRGESAEGPFDRITADPVPGAGTTDEPQKYRFVDSGFDPTKRYFYYVESISLSGVREIFTPVIEVKPKVETPASVAGAS